jgi:Pin2-interacting protein X1
MIFDKKTIVQLGSKMNDSAASKPSAYAMRMMEKMGWKEGQGLGKDETGIAEHIIIHKREDKMGLGIDNMAAAESVTDNWWHSAFTANLNVFKSNMKKSSKKSDKEDKKEKKREKKDKKNKKDKKDKESKSKDLDNDGENVEASPKKRKEKRIREPEETSGSHPSYDDLFAATGGARLGMRARREQKGKIRRTEEGIYSNSTSTAGNPSI